jgi:lipopolysaccharide/colanic/teichoic acid biosynthesis glycosyltransferase
MPHPLTKRILDFALSALGLLILSPLGLCIAVLIKLADGGPIFYGQTRVGQFGKPFRIWKFRSMVVNAEKLGAPVTMEGDPRITRIGRFLRKTKLDELPQLWNVLKGEMSLVGPRPELPKYVEQYGDAEREILRYKPGITDLASLLFRNEEDLLHGAADLESFYVRYCVPKKLELNQAYARRAGVFQDLYLILQTLCPYWLGVLTLYVAALSVSFWLAFLLRADFNISSEALAQYRRFLPLVLLPQLLLLLWQGEFKGLLSYFSIPEMRRTLWALAVALPVQAALLYGWQPSPPPAPSVLLIDFILSFLVLCGTRTALRYWREQLWAGGVSERPKRRTAIIGVNESGINLLLDSQRSPRSTRHVVALFDDDPRTWGTRPHQVPVVGMPECLLHQHWPDQLDEIIITLPQEQAARVTELCNLLKPLPLTVTVASDSSTAPLAA